MPSHSFASERCVPWLYSQAGVRPEGEPAALAPGLHAVRARHRLPAAFRAKFVGLLALCASFIGAMADARPAHAADASQASARPAISAALGGLSLGAFALGWRLDRNAPALAVLCAARGADLSLCAELVAGARRGLVDRSWPDGQVWLVAEGPLSASVREQAQTLGVRCFTPLAGGRISEV